MIKSGETICISIPHSKFWGTCSPVIYTHARLEHTDHGLCSSAVVYVFTFAWWQHRFHATKVSTQRCTDCEFFDQLQKHAHTPKLKHISHVSYFLKNPYTYSATHTYPTQPSEFHPSGVGK